MRLAMMSRQICGFHASVELIIFDTHSYVDEVIQKFGLKLYWCVNNQILCATLFMGENKVTALF